MFQKSATENNAVFLFGVPKILGVRHGKIQWIYISVIGVDFYTALHLPNNSIRNLVIGVCS